MVDGVIVLYDQNETSFTSNGLGYLPDATECTVIEELNGEFELEMEYPITGKRYDQIQHRRILYVKTNPYEDPQPFRIYNINKPIDGLVEVNARHISYDLSGYALPWISDGEGKKSKLPFATGPASAVENLPALVNQLNTGMQPFTYWTNSTEDYPRDPDDEKENELKEPHWIFIDTPTTARNLLGTFTEKYKGEFKFDKFNVMFYGPVSGQSEDDTHYRGKDSGVVLRYGKNLTDLMQEEDSDKGMYTHIYPFWSGSIDVQKEGSERSTTETKETVIELADKLYPVNSNVDPGYKRIYVYDVTSDYTDELKSKDGLGHPSEETLKEMCDKLIKENKLGTPNITLTASFVQLSKSVEYSNLALLEKILLGDTVTVDFPKLDVKSTLKCTAIEYNVLTDEYKTITLGDERNTSGGVSSTIASTASLSASNSTAIAGSATKQDVYGKSYDTALSTTSENAVQNKVITNKINQMDSDFESCCSDVKKKLDECFTSVSNGKQMLAEAITEKGVETSSTDTFLQMHDNILAIPTGGGMEKYEPDFRRRPRLVEYEWVNMQWNGLPNDVIPDAKQMWTDGENIYYTIRKTKIVNRVRFIDVPSRTYVLDKSTHTWSEKYWNESAGVDLDWLTGINIWTDGTNIYYSEWYKNSDSSGTEQIFHYVLDKSTDTWHQKNWDFVGSIADGEDDISGQNVWTYAGKIYALPQRYIPTYHYELNGNTWEQKEWRVIKPSTGKLKPYIIDDPRYLWSDGTNLYQSNTWADPKWGTYNGNYVYDETNDTWEKLADDYWSGIDNSKLSGTRIWTDGNNIYFSDSSLGDYRLDIDTKTWCPVTLWSGTGVTYSVVASASCIWTDGVDLYYNYKSISLVLKRKNAVNVRIANK